MRRWFTFVLTLSAWLLATGSHWDLVQTFAWGRMIATYSRTMPLPQAVKLTFTAENMCGLCEVVADAQTKDPTAPPTTQQRDLKITLACVPMNDCWIPRRPQAAWPALADQTGPSERTAPPVPPPRVG